MNPIAYYKPVTAVACIQILLISGLCMISEHVSANEGDTFIVEGVEYRIIDDSSVSVECVHAESIPNDLRIMCFVTDPSDGTTYTVTGIDDYAFRDTETVMKLYLPTTLMSVGQRAFEGLFDQTGVVIEEVILPGLCENNEVTVPGASTESGDPLIIPVDEYIPDLSFYEGKVRFIDEWDEAVEIRYFIGIEDQAELKATNIGDFENGYYESVFYKGCVNIFGPCEYERDYFECIGWSLRTEASEPDYDAESDIVVEDDFEPTDYYAVWEETGYDYPVWTFKVTSVIIILIAAIGIAVAVMQHLKARRA